MTAPRVKPALRSALGSVGHGLVWIGLWMMPSSERSADIAAELTRARMGGLTPAEGADGPAPRERLR
ncbi:MAG: hypothetical protein ACRDQB_16245 [Thermocrispum sp.]